MTGDEDWPCIEPGVLMKKNITTAALVVMPNAGHNINLEDPAAFNAHLQELFLAADAGTWPVRDPRAMAGSILGKQVDAAASRCRVIAAVDQHV